MDRAPASAADTKPAWSQGVGLAEAFAFGVSCVAEVMEREAAKLVAEGAFDGASKPGGARDGGGGVPVCPEVGDEVAELVKGEAA